MAKRRKVPLRKCIVTQEMKPKNDMIRIVRDKEGHVFVDPTGKKNGRGAYLTIERDVFERAQRERVIETTFQVDIEQTLFDDLHALVDKNES